MLFLPMNFKFVTEPGFIMHLNFMLISRLSGWTQSEANEKGEKPSPQNCKAAPQKLLFLISYGKLAIRAMPALHSVRSRK